MKKYLITSTLLLMLFSQGVFAQTNTQFYDVIHRDKVVGATIVRKIGNDQNFTITLNFSAEINLLVKTIVIRGEEHARFENGILKFGAVTRKVNDNIKTDNSIRQQGGIYMMYDGNQTHTLKVQEIRQNMLSLFFNEPDKNSTVYVDNLQKLVKLEEAATRRYVIQGKNDSNSTYVYQNGHCSSIILKNSLLTLTLRGR